jgi:sigma-54-specific transcriptional regulator
MDAPGVLKFVQTLANAPNANALVECLLKGIRIQSDVQVAVCYMRDALGEHLFAMAADGIAVSALPSITANELDNPLLFCMHSRETCFIDQPFALLGVGAGFDALRDSLSDQPSLLALPLVDVLGQAIGVLVLSGSTQVLHTWRNDKLWAAMLEIHQRLLSTLHKYPDRADASPGVSVEFAGNSPAARRIRAEIEQLAESALAVLITGETGAGKDHVALLIHQACARRGKAFVPVNCAAIPKELVEAELFGCTRGAYTGAVQAREGLVAAADGGTLFLDEIGDMPLSLQGTLLRLLNEKKYRPVGAIHERTSDFRLICATHQPLQAMVREGRFRQDLYFRICQLGLHLPALRSRREDIGPLVAKLIHDYNRQHQGGVAGISDEAQQVLLAYTFPGNVRELRNLILAACERTPCARLIEHDLLVALMRAPLTASHDQGMGQEADIETLRTLLQSDNLPKATETFERLMIDARLRQAGGSRSRAAESLGVPKRTLARKCQKWSMECVSNE